MGVHFGIDGAGRHAVYGNAAGGQFLSQRLRKADNRRLRGGVVHLAGGAAQSPNGGNIDNGAAVLLHQIRHRSAAAVIDAIHIGRKHLPPFFRGNIGKQLDLRNASIIHQDIQVAVLLYRKIDKRFGFLGFGQIRPEGNGFPTGLPQLPAKAFGLFSAAAIAQHHITPLRGQAAGHCGTDAPRCAGNNCDITYVTNNELGFDYLRDNMVIYKEQLVQRDLHYAIVDEVDSVLIDEARTPLIISGQSGKSTDLYKMCDYLARRMKRGTASMEISKLDAIMGTEIEEDGDYLVDEKDKQVVLTAQGVKEVEQFFHIDNFSDADNIDIQHNMIMALRAHALMFRDKDYVVKDDEVLIVDEFTGRIMPGRRFSDGLHQAIEAKENVKVKRESRTLATITFQNFFNKYKKKAGMTGTALTEEEEFREIYGMDVVVVPTNLPVQRIDHHDSIFKTKKEKLNAIVQAVVEAHDKGQPVLVGTITIDASEELSRMLTKRGIQHKVLNAKFHELEAEIVADAGQRGAVTIATNMAGRGTDIKLGEGVAELGGLKIIGTERHESRRIDNQLRGRAGRQGDPGESKFYLSLDDDLMRLFGSEKVKAVYDALKIPEGEEIQHKTISKFVEKAQMKIESNNFAIRKNLMEYDQVNNDQREVIYAERRRVLDGENMRDVIFKFIQDTVESYIDKTCSADLAPSEWQIGELNQLLIPIIPMEPIELTEEEKKSGKLDKFKQRIKEEAAKVYEAKEAEFPEPEHFREIERVVLLKVIDKKWMAHLDDMTQLRQGITLQAYGSKDPVVEYKFAGFDMFNEMTASIREDTVRMLLHVKIEQKVEREEVAKVTGTNKDDSVKKGPVRRESAKIGRNDPCPCGSGKKYKMCCGRNL
mgnify:CR=1 FL=1